MRKYDVDRLVVGQIIAPMIVIAFLTFAIGILIGFVNTPENQMAVILSSVSIGLALGIFVIQQIQGGSLKLVVEKIRGISETNTEISQNIKNIISEEKQKNDDKIKYVAQQISLKLTLINLTVVNCQTRYKIYEHPKADEKKKTEEKNRIFRLARVISKLVETKTSHLELVDYIGVDLAVYYADLVKWCELLPDYKDDEFEELMKHLEIISEKSLHLKREIEDIAGTSYPLSEENLAWYERIEQGEV